VPKVGASTGPQPKIGSTTGPQPKRDPTPLKPITLPRPDPTGPRAALAVVAPGAPLDGAPLVDSKPMALPSPLSPLVPLAPDSIAPPPPLTASLRPEASAPFAVEPQVTRPEKKIAREAVAVAPSVGPPPIADNVSPFAAALAQSASASGEPAPFRIDTGPVPLPPPPGAEDDLKIDDPSGVKSVPPIGARPSGGKPVLDTFGGVPAGDALQRRGQRGAAGGGDRGAGGARASVVQVGGARRAARLDRARQHGGLSIDAPSGRRPAAARRGGAAAAGSAERADR
jgi:hypothetical protein